MKFQKHFEFIIVFCFAQSWRHGSFEGGTYSLFVASNRSPFLRGGRVSNAYAGSELSDIETDISFISSGRPSIDRMSNFAHDYLESGLTPRMSTSSDQSFGSMRKGSTFADSSLLNFSSASEESGRTSSSSQSMVSTHHLQHANSRIHDLIFEGFKWLYCKLGISYLLCHACMEVQMLVKDIEGDPILTSTWNGGASVWVLYAKL